MPIAKERIRVKPYVGLFGKDFFLTIDHTIAQPVSSQKDDKKNPEIYSHYAGKIIDEINGLKQV